MSQFTNNDRNLSDLRRLRKAEFEREETSYLILCGTIEYH